MSGKTSKRCLKLKENLKLDNDMLNTLLDQGYNQNQIAKMYCISRQAVHSRINYNYVQSKKDNKLIRLANTGLSINEIAERLGYTYRGVWGALNRLGIDYKRKKRGRKKKCQ